MPNNSPDGRNATSKARCLGGRHLQARCRLADAPGKGPGGGQHQAAGGGDSRHCEAKEEAMARGGEEYSPALRSTALGRTEESIAQLFEALDRILVVLERHSERHDTRNATFLRTGAGLQDVEAGTASTSAGLNLYSRSHRPPPGRSLLSLSALLPRAALVGQLRWGLFAPGCAAIARRPRWQPGHCAAAAAATRPGANRAGRSMAAWLILMPCCA